MLNKHTSGMDKDWSAWTALFRLSLSGPTKLYQAVKDSLISPDLLPHLRKEQEPLAPGTTIHLQMDVLVMSLWMQ